MDLPAQVARTAPLIGKVFPALWLRLVVDQDEPV